MSMPMRFPPPLPATMRPETPKYFLEANNPHSSGPFILTPKTLLKYPNSHLTKELLCGYGPNNVWCVDNDYDAMKLLISRIKDKDAVDWREHSTTRLRLVSKYAFEMHLFEIEAEAQAAISLQIANNRTKTFILDSSIPLLKKLVKETNLDEQTMLPLFQEFIGLHIQQNYLPAAPQIYSSPSSMAVPMPMPTTATATAPAEKKIDDDDDSDIDGQYESLIADLVAGTKQISDIDQKLASISTSLSASVPVFPTSSISTNVGASASVDDDVKPASVVMLRVDPSIPVVLPSLASSSPQQIQ